MFMNTKMNGYDDADGVDADHESNNDDDDHDDVK